MIVKIILHDIDKNEKNPTNNKKMINVNKIIEVINDKTTIIITVTTAIMSNNNR